MREFYNISIKSQFQNNDIIIYSTQKEGKSIFAESCVRTLKNKIYKYMAAISKQVYINNLEDTFNKSNNTFHQTMKMKSTDVMSSTYIHLDVENNMKILNLKFSIVL